MEIPDLINLIEINNAAGHSSEQRPILMIQLTVQSMPGEIRQLAIALLALQSDKAEDSQGRDHFIQRYLGHRDESTPSIAQPLGVLKKLMAAWKAAQYFTINLAQASLLFIN